MSTLKERAARAADLAVPLVAPWVTARDRQAVADALASNWVAPVGPDLARFEAALCETTSRRHAVATVSCTAALHLACRLLGVGPGDEVWAPGLTFIASIAPAVQLGASAVFLDVDPVSWTLDPAMLADALATAARQGRLPRAIISTDTYGHPAELCAILATASAHGVKVISDSASGLGATRNGLPAGAGAAITCLSFNGNKIITTGGGGALLTDDAALSERARHLATQARDPAAHYEHSELGYNYALSNPLAALGASQLATLAMRVTEKRRIFDAYRAGLADLPGIGFMAEAPWARASRWLSVLTIDTARAGLDRDTLLGMLRLSGIETRPAWKPMHLQPVFAQARRVGGTVAEAIFATGLCLPSGLGLSPDQQGRIIERIRACLSAAGR